MTVILTRRHPAAVPTDAEHGWGTAGGRVVTAPTNGVAGIIPAVLYHDRRFVGPSSDDGVVRFLLTAGAIGLLFKENASISGAEVACQGEVGSAWRPAGWPRCWAPPRRRSRTPPRSGSSTTWP